jgi:hypothetical protein
MNDDLRRDLEAAGRRPVPEPRPEFQAELEERLLAVARSGAAMAAAGPPAQHARLRHRLAFGFAGGLAGAAVLIALAIVIGSLGVATAPDLELTGAVNVEVALADGTMLMDPDGLLLPDGSVVRVGAGGSARIGDVMLHAGDVATIDAGRLEVRPGSEASRSGGSTPPTVRPEVSAPPPTRAQTPTPVPASPTPPPAPSATPGAPTKAPPTATPGGTGSATATPGGARTPSPTTATPAPATPTPSASTVALLKLVARVAGPSEVEAAWTGTEGARRYRLVAWAWRISDGGELVRTARTVIGDFTRPPDPPLAFRVGADVVRVRLLVIAFAPDGSELTRSNAVRVSFRR